MYQGNSKIHPFLANGGEAAEIIANFDWSSTSMGPIDQWSEALKAHIALILRSPVAIVTLWNEDGVMIYNDAYSKFSGGRHPKLFGSKVREGWPEVADFNDNVMKVVLSGGTLAYRETSMTLYRNGEAEDLWLDLDYSPLLDEGGTPVGVIAIVVETTAKVRAERELNAEREGLRRMFDQAPGFIAMMAGPDHRFMMANQAYLSLVDNRDILGLPLAEALPEVPTQGFVSLLDQVYSTGEPYIGHGQLVKLRYDGREHERYLDFVYQPIVEEGVVTGIFVQGHDVTDARTYAEALKTLNETLEQRILDEVLERTKAEDQLRQIQKMEAVGQLTGGIAHDFNNMLAVIIGGLNLVQRKLKKGETDVDRFVEGAVDGARRAADLTKRLLAFSRQQPLQPELVNPNRMVSNMTELVARTLGEQIQVETVLGAGLWHAKVDPAQLESAILNLCVNARDAMPNGGRLTIETSNASVDDAFAKEFVIEPGQYVLVAVADTGDGMSDEVLSRAFDPFYTTKPTGKGTGLGLSQVYGFVRQSGGHVKIYSEAGVGTTVKIYLPRHYGEETLQPERPSSVAMHRGLSSEVVLVVEDENRVRAVSVEALRHLGYSVIEAVSPLDALQKLEANPSISLLFTDVVMPEMSGRELADRAKQQRPDLKVLYTTGYTRNAIVHNGMLDAGTSLLTKPFSIEELAAKVRGILDEG